MQRYINGILRTYPHKKQLLTKSLKCRKYEYTSDRFKSYPSSD